MYYADIKQYDVANGPGIRVSLFVSGCRHRCKDCFNPETWDFHYGTEFTEKTEEVVLSYLAPSYVKGLTLLGGDPLEPENRKALLPLMRRMQTEYPEKDVWCFTGYGFERDVLGVWADDPDMKEFLSYLDVLVDGEFVAALKNANLRFKGSENQRTILVSKSLKAGKTVLWDENQE